MNASTLSGSLASGSLESGRRPRTWLRKQKKALQQALLKEEAKITQLTHQIKKTETQLSQAEDEKSCVLQELAWYASTHPYRLDTAPLERKIKELSVNLHEKHLEVKRITDQPHSTSLLENYFASEEYLIEKSKQLQ